MPISRLVAVSFRPPSSVFRRTFVRTGRERFETARLTTDRPRARFSCMTDSFTSGSLQEVTGQGRLPVEIGTARGRSGGWWVSSLYLLIPSSPSSWCGRGGRRLVGVRRRDVDEAARPVDGAPRSVVGMVDGAVDRSADAPATASEARF